MPLCPAIQTFGKITHKICILMRTLLRKCFSRLWPVWEEMYLILLVIDILSFSKNELGNASQISLHVTKSSISIPRLCRRPFGMCSSLCHSLLESYWIPLASLFRRTVFTAHQPASDSACSSAKYHSKYWAVFIKGRHELSLNFDCSHYQNAATEILLAGTVA